MSQPESLGALLKYYRRRANKTQERLAADTGYTPGYISMLERGVRLPPPETVAVLADALDLADDERDALNAAGRAHLAPDPAHVGVRPSHSSSRIHNLPVQPSALLGRADEVATACGLLRRADVRLVTLIGPPGVGKTRLAIEVAVELLGDFPGIWLVRLARLADPALVLPTIAQTLGLKEAGRRPLADTLRAYLRDKPLLLVLDNCEHLVTAAGDIAGLLETCPGLKVLATSRVVLRLRGERRIPVPPLALPDPRQPATPERLARSAAVALFVERAREVRPDLQLTDANAPAIAAICARLDGLPLAIELAATHVRLLPPATLLARLASRLGLLTDGPRDLEQHQRTMRATLAWSEDLLSLEDQRLFRRLAVFAGGCILEAAEAICASPEGAEPLALDVLDGLSRLVDHSLIQQREEGGEARFGLLHVVREYANERLEASGEAEAARRAHAGYFLALAEAAEFKTIGPEQIAWLARLGRELDNLRIALAWARECGEAETGLRLAASLLGFWADRGQLGEGHAWVEDLLASAATRKTEGTSHVSVATQARALNAAGWLAFWLSDHATAAERAEPALVLAREAGDGRTAAMALLCQGSVALVQGDLDRAAVHFARSLERWRERGDVWGTGWAKWCLGLLAFQEGDLDGAAAAFEESIALGRRAGDRLGMAMPLADLGKVARRRGDFVLAEALGREALADFGGLGAAYVAVGLESLAMTAAAAGQAKRTAQLLGAAAALREAVAYPQTPFERMDTEQSVDAARTALGEAEWAVAFAAGRALSLEEAVFEALGETE